MASSYRETCFEEHGKECHFCGSAAGVEAHHIDGDRFNNSADNLLPVCEEHHKKIHIGTRGFEDWYERLREVVRKGTREEDKARLTVGLTETQSKYVEEYAKKEAESRAASVRHLLDRGLEAEVLEEEIKHLRNELDDVKKDLDGVNQREDLLRERINREESLVDRLINDD